MLLFDGFSNLCLANAVEPLRAANTLAGRALYTWEFLSLGTAPLASSSGLPVQPARLTHGHRGAYLFVMPSYGFQAFDTEAARRTLRAASGRFGTLVGLDTGSWLMASAGLLDGHRATSHWDVLDQLAERFPEVDVTRDRFVLDGARASCGGATTTLEMMLELVAQHHGATLALEVAALFMHGERAPESDPLRRLPPDRRVQAAAAVMRRNVEVPVSVGEVAAAVGCSQRALERVFFERTGRGPAALYRAIRLAEARRRLENTGESIAEIAGRCGYADASAMSRAFRREFGVAPREVRGR